MHNQVFKLIQCGQILQVWNTVFAYIEMLDWLQSFEYLFRLLFKTGKYFPGGGYIESDKVWLRPDET